MTEVIERIQIRRSADRGLAEHGWLKSFHSFSFADYFDPQHNEFGALRVINEDFIAPASGFGTHGHRDMEIITYVLEGELTHKDSIDTGGGTGAVIRPGDVQRMSAGTGVLHSEYNRSPDTPVHLLQIWIVPNVTGIAPSYEEKRFTPEEKRGRLRLVASGDGRDGSVLIHQDARVHAGLFDGSESATYSFLPGRRAYLHVVRGSIVAQGEELAAGDAMKLADPHSLQLEYGRDAEVLLFDLP